MSEYLDRLNAELAKKGEPSYDPGEPVADIDTLLGCYLEALDEKFAQQTKAIDAKIARLDAALVDGEKISGNGWKAGLAWSGGCCLMLVCIAVLTSLLPEWGGEIGAAFCLGCGVIGFAVSKVFAS